MSDKYILVDRKPQKASLMEWAIWFENAANRVVAKSRVGHGLWEISTMFLGIDHSFDDDGPPILFETMIFGGPHDGFQERYATWDQASAGHQRIKTALESGEAP